MGTYGNDYYDNLKMLEKYAESNYVGNQVFLGVKGVGKSYLFENYFTGGKIRELADKYKNVFIITALNNRAKESDCHSIGFPLISAGIFGYPKTEAWQVAIRACRDWISDNPDYDMDIVFAVLDKKILEMGKEAAGLAGTGW